MRKEETDVVFGDDVDLMLDRRNGRNDVTASVRGGDWWGDRKNRNLLVL